MKKIFFILILIPILILTACTTSKTQTRITYTDDLDYTNDSLKANGPFTTNAMPSKGNVNILVIPVNLDSKRKTQTVYNKIKNAFDGECDWYSVKDYYEESSYGKLHLSFEFTDWYTPKYTASYYEKYEDDFDDGSTILLREALDNYDSTIDYSKYDSDNDGYIDTVWLVYNCETAPNSFWWAFSFVNQTTNTWDNKKARYYAFAGIDFMEYNTVEGIDTTTFIHETGHCFGLDDYYSYNSNSSPLYGLDMMDKNVGDHCSISKILLGWVTPKVITETETLDLAPYYNSGEVLLVADHPITTIYDEYFLIDFYQPKGIDEYAKVYSKLQIGVDGIRVYHVDATINTNTNNEIIYNTGDYQTAFKYDNTDTNDHFVELLKANAEDNVASFFTWTYLYDSTSKTFGVDIYKTFTLHDGNKTPFSMTVNSIEEAKANLTITFK